MSPIRDDLASPATPAGEPIDPVKLARRDLKRAVPRRFWTDAAVVERQEEQGLGFGVELDGRPLRTPAKAVLAVPNAAIAEAVAAEWRAQGETLDPDSMPVTKLVNSAIDGVAQAMEATIAEVAKFSETDLVCYRAGEPETLVAAQAAAWDPVLAFAREKLGGRFVCSEGVMYVEQPQAARTAVRQAVADLAVGPGGALRLAALSVMTSLTGSILLALAVALGHMNAETAWRAAHVDEDHQAGLWGDDSEAAQRRALRWRDMAAAALVLDLLR